MIRQTRAQFLFQNISTIKRNFDGFGLEKKINVNSQIRFKNCLHINVNTLPLLDLPTINKEVTGIIWTCIRYKTTPLHVITHTRLYSTMKFFLRTCQLVWKIWKSLGKPSSSAPAGADRVKSHVLARRPNSGCFSRAWSLTNCRSIHRITEPLEYINQNTSAGLKS